MATSGAPPEAMKRGMTGGKVFLVVIIMLALGFGGGWFAHSVYGPQPGGPPQLPARIIVGTNTPFPPFEYRDPNTDEVVGFDIDLITEALDRIGYDTTEWELFDFRDFSALLTAVGENSVHIAVSAITMNGAIGAERNATMDFTDSYYESDQGILKRTPDATVYCADENDCLASELDGLRVAVQAATSSEYWVADNLPTATVTTYPDVTQVLQALQTNQVDIIVIDRPAALGIAAGSPNQYTVAGTIQTNELFSFAVANEDPFGIVPLLNNALDAMRNDATYDEIVNRWF